MIKRGIVWFRLDLRLHDNEALTEALHACDEVVPVYVFDPRTYSTTTRYGFPKTGIHRARFIRESVIDLRTRLEEQGSGLIVLQGQPEEVLFDLARELKTSWVFCNRERTRDEVEVQDHLEKNLWSIGQEMRYSRGKMLYYTQDLPFPVTQTPDTFSGFRKEVERYTPIRKPLPVPVDFKFQMDDFDAGDIPNLDQLAVYSDENRLKSTSDFTGGETEALEQMQSFANRTNGIRQYKESRNEIDDSSPTSRISPWLSQGCISPKKVYQFIKTYEDRDPQQDATGMFFSSLLWRDFLRLMGKKHGGCLFTHGGLAQSETSKGENLQEFEDWMYGKTGVPIIDACMNQLNQTGYIAGRGRALVASFLVNDLNLRWQMGAEYFESMLIDYDPCSNYGNWNYIAGLDLDSQRMHDFNLASQVRILDPNTTYICKWAPQYNNLSKQEILQMHELAQYK